jgi:hypothetical protein
MTDLVERAGYRILRMPDGTETRFYVGSVHINWQTGKRTWIPPDDGLPYLLDESSRIREDGK